MTLVDALDGREEVAHSFMRLIAEMWNERLTKIAYADERAAPEWIDHGGEG